jgi:hypothetical protein
MARYAVLGEDLSDGETLRVLIRRLAGNERLTVKIKGYDGCGQLLRKGARDLDEFLNQGYDRFVVGYDADRDDPAVRLATARAQVVDRSRAALSACCIVVPIEELEAWLLADVAAVSKKWPGWRPEPVASPERVPSPKEYLEKLSRDSQRRPRYSHAVDNPILAGLIDLERVEKKCPSFRVLCQFVRDNP